jgi:hypothetical protein
MSQQQTCYRTEEYRVQSTVPVLNFLRSPRIESRPDRPVRQPYLSLHRLAESIPGLFKRLQIQGSVLYKEVQLKKLPTYLGKELVLALMKERIPRQDKRDLLSHKDKKTISQGKNGCPKDKGTVSQNQKYSLTRKK